MHIGSYKSLWFFQVSDIGWFHTFAEFWKHLDIGWDDVWSRWCFPLCYLDHAAAKIMVARLCDNFQVSHLVAKFELCKNLSKDAKKMFVSKLLAKGHCMPGVKLDKHYAWCMACKIQLIFCFLLLRLSLQNLILVLTGPYLGLGQVPGNHTL